MSTLEDRLAQRAATQQASVALPDSADPRTIEAARTLEERGIARPFLITADTRVDEAALTNHLLERRASKGLTKEQAEALAALPLYKAAWLVETGEMDAGVAGSISTTSDVIRAGLWVIGAAADVNVVSSFFLMTHPSGHTLTYADCGVVPDPTAEQLADIAWSASQNHKTLTEIDPRVAFLSFSTKGSAQHSHVQKVQEAFQQFSAKHPEIVADGELQFDAAFVPVVAHRKAANSPLAGMANVLIFPDLDAGNIAYKITERLAGFKAYGPIVQGLRRPFVDLSRGCTADDIVMAAVIAILQSQSVA
ncbi:MAG: phosphate acetyltransferase [Bradyrhizobiaceae bacterium]|nr:phosphate acetyltransferase [Bradyrhizobiaceae bacterium]